MASVAFRAYGRLIVRLIVVAAFLLAALPKIQDPVAFIRSIEGFRVFPGVLPAWIALLLPWLELVISIGLLTPFLRRASGSITLLLLILFISLHLSAWFRGLDISCGCYGSDTETLSTDYPRLVLRNLALLIGVGWLLVHDWRNFPSSKATENPSIS